MLSSEMTGVLNSESKPSMGDTRLRWEGVVCACLPACVTWGAHARGRPRPDRCSLSLSLSLARSLAFPHTLAREPFTWRSLGEARQGGSPRDLVACARAAQRRYLRRGESVAQIDQSAVV